MVVRTELAARIDQVLALDPDQGAIAYQDRWFSWGDIAAVMSAVDRNLGAANLGEGTAVGVVVSNKPQLLAAVMGIVLSGRCVVTLNPYQTATALAEELRRLRLPALIADSGDVQKLQLEAVARELGSQLMLTGTGAKVSCADGLEAPGKYDFHRPLPGVAMLMLSSGTTGPAKRIELLFRNFERAILDVSFYEAGNGGEIALKRSVAFSTLPLVHIGGVWTAMANLVVGRSLVMFDKFNVAEWQAAVIAYRPKLVALAPAAIRMIYDANLPREDLASLVAIRGGSAPLDPDFADAFKAKYGIPILDSYGATEFGGGVAGWTWPDFQKYSGLKRGSVGRANEGVQLRIVDPESGAVLAAETKGLLEVRGKQIRDGEWVRTADLAKLDEEGFLYILGRADDAILRGGFKISPQHVVQVLRKFPGVGDVSVVGLPDERLGAVPVAALEMRPGVEQPDENSLREFAKEHLVAYQVPVQFKVVAALPRTPSLKVSQPGVKALFKP